MVRNLLRPIARATDQDRGIVARFGPARTPGGIPRGKIAAPPYRFSAGGVHRGAMADVPYIGEILSIGAALFWAIGVILFKRAGEAMPPLALNLFKGIVALALFPPTMIAAGVGFAPDVAPMDVALLFASGVIGISIADTMFFFSLEKLGAGLTAVVDTSYTPFIVVLTTVFLGERLGPLEMVGAALIVGALIMGSASRPEKGRTRRDIVAGVVVGVVGIGVMAVGIVMIKRILDRPEVDMIWATWIRVVGGFVGVVPIVALHPRRRALLAALKPSRAWVPGALGAVFGTYLAMTAWVGGMKYCDVSRSALLNQLSTIFIFLFATIFLKERLTARRVIAIALAVTGAYFVII
jgi:drug/metabolite transporter (DMT)-like permease